MPAPPPPPAARAPPRGAMEQGEQRAAGGAAGAGGAAAASGQAELLLRSDWDHAACEYLKDHGVPQILDAAVTALLDQRPTDAGGFFSRFFNPRRPPPAAALMTPPGHVLPQAAKAELVGFSQHVHYVEMRREEDAIWSRLIRAGERSGIQMREKLTNEGVQDSQKKDHTVIKRTEGSNFERIEVAAGKREALTKKGVVEGQQREHAGIKKDEDDGFGIINRAAGKRREITFRNILGVQREEYGALRKEEVDHFGGIERAAGKRVGWTQADFEVETDDKPEWESGDHADFIRGVVPDVSQDRMELQGTADEATLAVNQGARVVAVIGATGHGKSSLCCALVGERPGDVQAQTTFKVAATAAHVTETVQVLTGRHWFDDPRSCEMFLVDTPGLHDERGVDKDAENIQQMIRVFKRLPKGVHAFLLVISADCVRFDDALMSTVRYFEEQFGRDFWHNVVFVVQRWECHTIAVMKRAASGVSEEQRRDQYLAQLEEKFPHSRAAHIPFAFVDTHAHIYETMLKPDEQDARLAQWHILNRCVTQQQPHITNNMLMQVPAESQRKATELYGAAELELRKLRDQVDPDKPSESITQAIAACEVLRGLIERIRAITPGMYAQQNVARFRLLLAERIADCTRVHLVRRDRAARRFNEPLVKRYEAAVAVPQGGGTLVDNPKAGYLAEFDKRWEGQEGTEAARASLEGALDEHWGKVKTEWCGEVAYNDEDGDEMLFRPAEGQPDALQYLVNGVARPPFRRLMYNRSLGIPGLAIPDLGRGFRLPQADTRRVLGGLRVLALRVGIECNIEEDEEVPDEEGLPTEDADKLIDERKKHDDKDDE